MAINKQKVGIFAMEAIDEITKSWEHEDVDLEKVETGDMMLTVEMRVMGEDGEIVRSLTETYTSDPRPHVAFGMARAGVLAVEEGRQ